MSRLFSLAGRGGGAQFDLLSFNVLKCTLTRCLSNKFPLNARHSGPTMNFRRCKGIVYLFCKNNSVVVSPVDEWLQVRILPYTGKQTVCPKNHLCRQAWVTTTSFPGTLIFPSPRSQGLHPPLRFNISLIRIMANLLNIFRNKKKPRETRWRMSKKLP